MPRYDNYTPEINYGEEVITERRTYETREDKPSGRKSRKPSKNNRERQKPEKPRKKPKNSTFNKIGEWFRSPSARLLGGLLLGCFTIYLAVSFISYFSTCIPDQSKIAAADVGNAKGISNPGGEGGARLAEMLINQGFGVGALVIIFWAGALSLKTLIGRPRFKTLSFTIKCLVALIAVSLIVGLITYSTHTAVNWGGYHGTYVNDFIIHFIGYLGAVLLSLFMVALFIVICLRDLTKWIIKIKKKRDQIRRKIAEEKAARAAREEEIRRMHEQEALEDQKTGEAIPDGAHEQEDDEDNRQLEFSGDESGLYEYIEEDDATSIYNAEEDPATESAESEQAQPAEGEAAGAENEDSTVDAPMVVNVNEVSQCGRKRFKPDIEHIEAHKYKFPPFQLLAEGSKEISVDADEQHENKLKIRKTLLDFGIPITKIEATVGPTVTLYEIVPDKGVKIARIRSLVDEIAMNLEAKGVRIIAPIPGKGTVGIEVANKDAKVVSMRTVIQSNKYQRSGYNLPLAIGQTISNDVYITDLTKMPHLLVAGATGQGKSVGLNAIIASILYCKAPHEVKFVMIDPKQVEFGPYNKLKNYYLAAIPGEEDEPVLTDMTKVEATLNSLCIEMEMRYKLLKNAETRNIEEYNAKIRKGLLNPADGHRFLPYIIIVIDEFGDLKMVLGNNIEKPIARIAQKARAVGMHVIIATQRPSTDVITGIIKANFPARISFKVSQGVDSKTILDTMGAQQLIGSGDMLIFNNSEMIRVQCAYMSTPEVESICKYIEHQPYPQGVYLLPEPEAETGEGGGSDSGGPSGERDNLFIEVARAVVKSGKASTSSVQRHYEIGYNRAGRIMDQLERAGIVGPSQGGKPRAVLMNPMDLEEYLSTL